ncbi:MAG: InlB B-repeat-containing protein [Candidatus Izimaplasma sp.]|nr:InlB B-repeat-containing protein [Candidatus Izimaplasma bacterium]
MKKLLMSLALLFSAFMVLSFTEVKAEEPVTFDFNYEIIFPSGPGDPQVLTGVSYGQKVSIDVGTHENEVQEFLGFVVQDKVIPTIDSNLSIRVTDQMDVKAYFKPAGSVAVIFMDTNQDQIDVLYTDGSDLLNEAEVPDYNNQSKPGLAVTGWSVVTTQTFTEDTIVYPVYSNASGTRDLTVDNGTGAGTYDYNEVVTVTASGTGTFNYWLKDGLIASLDETYTFSMVGNHHLEAVYDVSFIADSDIFITISPWLELKDNQVTVVGQFDLPEDEEVVEWGILTSAMPGGITFDTPDVTVYNSNKYNPNTKEFMMSFSGTIETAPYYRAFVKTANTVDDSVTTTYSYVEKEGYTDELFISEYIEGGSYNKAIEIFNGTGQDVDLTPYTVEVYFNGSSSSGTPIDLTGTLVAGDVYIIAHTSADETIKSIANDLTGSLSFNGDDAVTLSNDGTIIDMFGVVGTDPGSSWPVGTGSTADNTLVRDASVISPSSTWDESEWVVEPKDTFSYLGSHDINYPTMPVMASELADSLSISGDNSVNVAETISLTESYPQGGLEAVIWVSSNETYATVNQDGVVTGVAEGQVSIYAYSYFDHDIYATYTVDVLPVQTYDVTFESNGGSAVTMQTIDGGNTASEPTDPTRTGFVFDGWYTDDTTFNNLYNFSDSVTENITLYAKWIEEFTVTFESNGGSAVSSETVLDGELATEPTDPTKTDYVFDGWFTDDTTFVNEFNFATDTITADITLYAKWVDEAVAETTYTQDFAFLTSSTSSYSTSVSVAAIDDPNGFPWELLGRQNVGSWMLGNAADGSYIQVTAQGGISSITFDVVRAFTNTNVRSGEVFVNDISVGTFNVDVNSNTAQTITIEGINVTGEVIIKIVTTSPGTRGAFTVDNIEWTTYSNPQ